MAFSSFRYHPDAEKGFLALFQRRGEELKQRICAVQAEWGPDEDEAVFVVPFHGSYLIFTVAQEDKSILVLAAVEQVPSR